METKGRSQGAKPSDTAAKPEALSRISSFHAHIYYDPSTTRDKAERLRERQQRLPARHTAPAFNKADLTLRNARFERQPHLARRRPRTGAPSPIRPGRCPTAPPSSPSTTSPPVTSWKRR